MTLQEMFERVLINSGQFQFAQDQIELNVDPFKTLVKFCLGIYNTHVPISKHVFKSIQSTRQYEFTDTNTIEGIPESIIDLVPVRIAGVVPYYFREYDRPKSTVDVKIEYPFVYRKPILTVPVSADYDLHCLYFHKLTPLTPTDQKQFEVKTISDNEHEFIDLVTAHFLIGLGRSRRAFTIQELPITTDASDLVSEGKEMKTEVMEDLEEKHSKWYLAWGG